MSHITLEERSIISHLLSQNVLPSEIARQLCRQKSTIAREIKRNQDLRSGQYRCDLAQRKAISRKENKATRNSYTPEIQALVEKQLQEKFSPEQISGLAKKHGVACVSHETIYKIIWEDKKSGGKLHENLRHRQKRYRKRGVKKDKRGQIPRRRDIDTRSPEVAARQRLGDLEIDLIIGEQQQGAILTINDRVSGLLRMEKLQSKDATELTAKLIARLLPHKDTLYTITSDNGKEFAGHETIASELGIDFFFAKPYHSWERGSNENLNGLIRQYFPKKTNLLHITEEEIKNVETALNNRPRKRHNYLTPNQIHHPTPQQPTNVTEVALAS